MAQLMNLRDKCDLVSPYLGESYIQRLVSFLHRDDTASLLTVGFH